MKNEKLQAAIEKITEQQPKNRTAVWMVGEQLKDILRHEPHLAELVLQDLENKEMNISKCEGKIKEFAKKNGGCCIPMEADRIIREFYGLSAAEVQQAQTGKVIDFASFF